MNTREQEVYRIATELYAQGPDWVTYFREVLGLDGIVRKAYTTPELLAAFEQSKEFSEIQYLLAKLRGKGDQAADDREPTRVITVRLPKSLHELLRTEAHERKTSMNKLCISKLLQMVDEELVPADG
jgi:predicted HicB family RNase H-like nuclease